MPLNNAVVERDIWIDGGVESSSRKDLMCRKRSQPNLQEAIQGLLEQGNGVRSVLVFECGRLSHQNWLSPMDEVGAAR